MNKAVIAGIIAAIAIGIGIAIAITSNFDLESTSDKSENISLLRPQGKLVLSMNDNAAVKSELLHYLDALGMAT